MPGAFDRLMSMAERQQEATITGASEARRYLRNDNQRGHYLGAAVTALAIGGAVMSALNGQVVVASLLVGVPVLSVAKALIESVRQRPDQTAIVSERTAEQQPRGDEAE